MIGNPAVLVSASVQPNAQIQHTVSQLCGAVALISHLPSCRDTHTQLQEATAALKRTQNQLVMLQQQHAAEAERWKASYQSQARTAEQDRAAEVEHARYVIADWVAALLDRLLSSVSSCGVVAG